MNLKHLIFFLFCLTASTVFGQEEDSDLRTIEGVVTDANTGEPISFANVGIPRYGIGTATGQRGQFVFRVPRQMVAAPVEISAIGYESYRVGSDKISGALRVELRPVDYEISEFTLVGRDPVDIVREAVRRIPQNYPTYPTDGLAFYRESRMDSAGSYQYLAEGVLHVYKGSYEKSKFYDVGLVQGRKVNLENPLDTVVRSRFSSGHLAPHRFDVVKNLEDFLEPKLMDLYRYEIARMTGINDRPVYVIEFGPNPDKFSKRSKRNLRTRRSPSTDDMGGFFSLSFGNHSYYPRMRGKIFIDQENYAILRTEFEMTDKALRNSDGYPLYMGSWSGNRYVTNYRPLGNGKYYFNNALREGDYGRRSDGGSYVNEVWMTEVSADRGDQVPYQERLGRNQKFVNLTGSYDPDFWRNYNTIPPSAELDNSLTQARNAAAAAQALDPDYLDALQVVRDSIAEEEARRLAEEQARLRAEEIERLKQEELEAGRTAAEAQANAEARVDSVGIEENPFDDEQFDFEPRRRTRRVRTQGILAAGIHHLTTPGGAVGVTYAENGTDETFAASRTISGRDYEFPLTIGSRVVWNDRWILAADWSYNFQESIYRNNAIGAGVQFNLSRQRPVYLKLIAQHNRLRYARRIDVVDNPVDRFEFDDKRINSNRFNLYYGTRTYQARFTGEFSIELNRNRELYLRGSYHLPWSERPDVWIKERGFLSKKDNLKVEDPALQVFFNDAPKTDAFVRSDSWWFTVGLLFK